MEKGRAPFSIDRARATGSKNQKRPENHLSALSLELLASPSDLSADADRYSESAASQFGDQACMWSGSIVPCNELSN